MLIILLNNSQNMTTPQVLDTQIKSKTPQKPKSLQQVNPLSQHIKHLEEWVRKLGDFFSISIKNIQEYSADNVSFVQQFTLGQRDTSESQYVRQFQSLVKSFALQLTYFQKNSKFAQSQFVSTYSLILKKIKYLSSDTEILGKANEINMEQSVSDILAVIENFKEKVRSKSLSSSSDSSVSSKSSDSDKENAPQIISNSKLAEFMVFFQKMIQRLNKNTDQIILNSPKLAESIGGVLFTLNEQIVFYAKKLNHYLLNLFKNLLEQTSNKFLQFKASWLAPIFDGKLCFSIDGLEMSLFQYGDINIAKTDECVWLKQYLLNIKVKLATRNQFCQRYFSLVSKYQQIIQKVTNSKYKVNQKESLRLLGKTPSLINQKTQVMIESMEATSGCVFAIMQKLSKQINENIKNTKSYIDKIDYFVKRSTQKIQQLEQNKSPKEVCTKLIDLIQTIGTQEDTLNKSFENSIQKIIYSIFFSFSETQSRLLVTNETYFGLTIRDITKHIRNWSKTYPQTIIKNEVHNKRKQIIKKAIISIDQFKHKNPKTDKKIIKFEVNKTTEQPKIEFFGLYNKDIGVLRVFPNRVSFQSIVSNLNFMIKGEQITNVSLTTNGSLEISRFKNEVFNLFDQTVYAVYVLKSLILKKITIKSKKSIAEPDTLDNSSQQEQEEVQHIQKMITLQQQKSREAKLKDIINKKQFQKLNTLTLDNVNCIHLIHVLFGEKDFICNNKKQKQFYYYFKEKQGELNFKPEQWDQNPMKYVTSSNIEPDTPLIFKRLFRFDHPIASMGIPFIPKTCNSREIQSLVIISKDQFMVESEVQSTGAPYTDCFILRVRSIFTNIGNDKVKLQIFIYMQWVKRTMMKSMVQKQGYGETKTANETYVKILNQTIKKYPYVPISPPIRKSLIKPKQLKIRTNSPAKIEQIIESPQNKQNQIKEESVQNLSDKQIQKGNKSSRQLVLFKNQNTSQITYEIAKKLFVVILLGVVLQYFSP